MDPDSVTSEEILSAIRRVQEEEFRMVGDQVVEERDQAHARSTHAFQIRQLRQQTDRFRQIMAKAGNPGLERSPASKTGPPGGAGVLGRMTFQPKITPAKKFWPLAVERQLLTHFPEPKVIVLTPNGQWWRGGYSEYSDGASELSRQYALTGQVNLNELDDPAGFSSIEGTKSAKRFDLAVAWSIAEVAVKCGLDVHLFDPNRS